MDLREIQERMNTGRLYYANDSQLAKEQEKQMELLYEYNHTRPSEGEKRDSLMREMFAEVGENCYIEPPLHANWAGKFVHMGKGVYANFNLTLVDDAEILSGTMSCLDPMQWSVREHTQSARSFAKSRPSIIFL